ncbi:lytic transglycosylase domain-containing protein [Pandoraea sp. CB10b_02]|uniref:lytic transglycosylase domain-containing protein n=1 Tax=Pandoraea sp. CB10b_02 TaxID=2014535 RepID=UPI00257AE235|nr:lytic transglycosylase domain-containing protein [Pandoraea sp. CB10b_02]
MTAPRRRAGRFAAWTLTVGAGLVSLSATASTPGLLPRHPRVADAQLAVPAPRVVPRAEAASQARVPERIVSDTSAAASSISQARPFDARPFDALVRHAARAASLEAALLHAIIETESGYDPLAVSPRGAIGLMQVLPRTGARFGVRRLEDPAENLRAGAAYLRWLLERFDGELVLALAAYNAGEGAVLRHGRRIPPFPETQNYVRKVMAGYSRLADADPSHDQDAWRRERASPAQRPLRRESLRVRAAAAGVATRPPAGSDLADILREPGEGAHAVQAGASVARAAVAPSRAGAGSSREPDRDPTDARTPSPRATADAAAERAWRLLRGLGEWMTRSPSARMDDRDRPAVVMPPRQGG